MNCWVEPFAIDALAGVMAIDFNVAAVTVRAVDPLMPPEVALMVALPAATPVATPPAAMLATPVLVELHVADALRFCVLPLLYVPVAVNCCVRPFASEALAGVTAMETNIGAVSVLPVPDMLMPSPAPEPAATLLIAIAALLTPAASEILTRATVPFEIALEFMPQTKHE